MGGVGGAEVTGKGLTITGWRLLFIAASLAVGEVLGQFLTVIAPDWKAASHFFLGVCVGLVCVYVMARWRLIR